MIIIFGITVHVYMYVCMTVPSGTVPSGTVPSGTQFIRTVEKGAVMRITRVIDGTLERIFTKVGDHHCRDCRCHYPRYSHS